MVNDSEARRRFSPLQVVAMSTTAFALVWFFGYLWRPAQYGAAFAMLASVPLALWIAVGVRARWTAAPTGALVAIGLGSFLASFGLLLYLLVF